MNTPLKIAALFIVVLLLGGVYAFASQQPVKAASVARMPPPAANATEGNVPDMSQ